jgi:hypothetical protein
LLLRSRSAVGAIATTQEAHALGGQLEGRTSLAVTAGPHEEATVVVGDQATFDVDLPLLQAGKSYEAFVAGMTAVWQYSADLFWKMHEVVREANPNWNPPTEGNEPSA